jgi:hypothetical protein
VALNLASRPAQLTMPAGATARTLLTTYLDREGKIASSLLPLRSDEGVILDLSQ